MTNQLLTLGPPLPRGVSARSQYPRMLITVDRQSNFGRTLSEKFENVLTWSNSTLGGFTKTPAILANAAR